MKKFKNKETGAIYTAITPAIIDIFSNDNNYIEIKEKVKGKAKEENSEEKKNENPVANPVEENKNTEE